MIETISDKEGVRIYDLSPYTAAPTAAPNVNATCTAVDEDEEYEVTAIVAMRFKDAKRHFLVEWNIDNSRSWVPEENLEGAREAKEAFLRGLIGPKAKKLRDRFRAMTTPVDAIAYPVAPPAGYYRRSGINMLIHLARVISIVHKRESLRDNLAIVKMMKTGMGEWTQQCFEAAVTEDTKLKWGLYETDGAQYWWPCIEVSATLPIRCAWSEKSPPNKKMVVWLDCKPGDPTETKDLHKWSLKYPKTTRCNTMPPYERMERLRDLEVTV